MAYDLTGQVFGRLTVKKFAGRMGKNKVRTWECECTCGKTCFVSTSALRNSSTRSCGCLYNESRSTMKRGKDIGLASFNIVYRDYKNRASKLNVPFELTEDDFRAIAIQSCTYCGIEPLQFRKHGKKNFNGDFLHNGLDRVDNTQGYTKNNVVACCGICNKAKRDMPLEDFIIWINRLVQFQIKK